jgi:hypothetical protein
LENLEGDGTITLRWLLKKLSLWMGGRWKWLGIVSTGQALI